MADELLERYLGFLYCIGDELQDVKLCECPNLWSEAHTLEKLSEILTGVFVSEKVVDKLKTMWQSAKPEYFCYCCGTPMLYGFSDETNSFVHNACHLLLEEVLPE